MRNISVGAMAFPSPVPWTLSWLFVRADKLVSISGMATYYILIPPWRLLTRKTHFEFWLVLCGSVLYTLETRKVSGSAYKDDDLHPCQRFVWMSVYVKYQDAYRWLVPTISSNLTYINIIAKSHNEFITYISCPSHTPYH